MRICSRTAAFALGALWVAWMATAALAAPAFGPWAAPVNLESLAGTSPEVNTPYLDGCPIQAPDGLSLFIASNRPGGLGGIDIWTAHRTSPGDPWGPPTNLGAPINSAADDFCPTPIGDRLLFVSSRAGGCGGADIYVAAFKAGRGWQSPSNLGCHVNSPAGEAGPSLVKGAFLFFSSNRAGGFAPEAPGVAADSDLYVSALLPGSGYGPATLVPGLNTAAEDARPNVRGDGLEIVFDSTRPGTLGGPDLYTATRASLTDPWSAPVNLGPAVNTASSETRASLSSDGLTMLFGSNRPGGELAPDGTTSNDLYVTTRQALPTG